MIPAIQNGRLKIPLKEDNLTSSIFQLLTYLPNNLLVNIFQNTIGKKIEEELGNLVSIEFWSKWHPKGTRNKNYVEPDVFLRFDNIDIIVEAKRYDLKGQDRNQWKKELISYRNDYPDNERKVTLWALGGNKNLDNEYLKLFWKENEETEVSIEEDCKIVKTTWLQLLAAIKSIYFKYRISNDKKAESNVEKIFEDLIYSFQIYGFFVGTWIGEIGFEPIEWEENSLNYFQENVEKYDNAKWLCSLEPINITINNFKV